MNIQSIKVATSLLLLLQAAQPCLSAVEKSGNAEGPALLFIPGLASHGNLWEPWSREYTKSHSIYILTPPGFAGVPAETNSASFLQPSVSEMMTALRKDQVKQVTIIGHSIGGLMSLMLAQQAPELIDQILIVDSLPFLGGLFMQGLSPEVIKTQAKLIEKQMSSMPRKAFDSQQQRSYPSLVQSADFIPTLVRWGKDSDQHTIAKAFSEALSTDLRADLGVITCPVTILAAHSPESPMTKEHLKTEYENQYKRLPNKTIRIINNSHHFIMIDQPEIFSQTLSSLLN